MQTIALSESALLLLRLHVERKGDIAVDGSTREAYRELAGAGLMIPGHSFTGGRESLYRLTREGFEFVNAPSPSGFASPRR
jgi:hypothetical protein